MKRARFSILCVAGVLALALAGGCGGNGYSSSPGNGGNNGGNGNGNGGGSAQATIANMDFSSLTVARGTTVTWKNNDAMPHTATSDPGSAFAFDTGTISPGAVSNGVTFSQSGTFAYHCTVHPNMHGSITVQ